MVEALTIAPELQARVDAVAALSKHSPADAGRFATPAGDHVDVLAVVHGAREWPEAFDTP